MAMRRMLAPVFGLMVAAFLIAEPAPSRAATELEALRDDLRRTQEDFRKLLDLQQQTQRRMEELQKKMDAVESAARAQAAPAPTAPAPPATAPIAAAPPSPVPPGRLGFSMGGRALLFDLGVAADTVGNLSSARDPQAGQVPTFPGQANRIFPREMEIAVQGAVDPYVRGDVIFEFGQEGEIQNGGVTRSFTAELGEAYLTTLSLPWGLQFRGGLVRPQFGLLNHLHAHDLPQTDAPNVLVNFLGQEGLKESGVELSWVPPLPFYLEVRGGAYNGDSDPSFGGGNIRNPMLIGRIKTFFELGDNHGLQIGASVADGPNSQNTSTRSLLAGGDFKYKWKPLDRPYTQFILAGEYLFSHQRRQTEVPVDLGLGDGSFVLTSLNQVFNRQGFYVFGDYQLSRRWFFGTRFDWSQFPGITPIPAQNQRGAREYAIAPYLTFKPSEFFQLRAEYKHTQRNYTKNADEAFLQASFILGTHPPHPW
jgi:hypothetical protein